MIKVKEVNFKTENFSLLEIAEGVYAAIEKGDNTGSNAGFIDLGNYTVVFDTFLNIDASRELMEASEQFTGRKASFVINSHSHTDHIVGNSLFPASTVVISSKKVREMIEFTGSAFEKEKDEYKPRIIEVEGLLNTVLDDRELKNLNNELNFLRNLVKPGVKIRVPDLTFESEVVIHGSKRSLKLVQCDIAHSPGDLWGYIPEEKICFAGDLLFADYQPWFGSGNPEKLIETLEELLKYDIECIVPGHGRLSTKEDILLQIQYLKEMLHLVEGKKSNNLEDYSVEELSPVFRQWRGLCFHWNIRYLINRINK